jgi:hypothetical protein
LAAEAARRVAGLRPRHLAAVAEIGSYAALPDGSSGLDTLHEWHSPLSCWVRRVRQLGLLD